ncbi:MAG: hypothetical protein U0074_24475 [Kouleothrix sp.]
MSTRDNVHPITDADLDAHRDSAEFRMQNVLMRGVAMTYWPNCAAWRWAATCSTSR